SPKQVIEAGGVDALCLGGSKNGLAFGEAVIFFNPELAEEFDYRCKQAGQLASKMRYVSSQWLGLLSNDTWLKYARHANAMAERLERNLRKAGIEPLFPRQANSVFVLLDSEVYEAMLKRGWMFYNFIGGASRLMCTWDTTEADVDRLTDDLVAVTECSAPGQPAR